MDFKRLQEAIIKPSSDYNAESFSEAAKEYNKAQVASILNRYIIRHIVEAHEALGNYDAATKYQKILDNDDKLHNDGEKASWSSKNQHLHGKNG